MIGGLRMRSFFSAGDLSGPCFHGLADQEAAERIEILRGIPCLQRLVIALAVLLVDGDGRMVVHDQEIIHGKPSGAPVAVCKRMDVLKFRMKICRCSSFMKASSSVRFSLNAARKNSCASLELRISKSVLRSPV